MSFDWRSGVETRGTWDKAARSWPRTVAYSLTMLLGLVLIGRAGAPLPVTGPRPAPEVVSGAGPVYAFRSSFSATVTPTVTLAPTAVPPSDEGTAAYLPLIQKDRFIPGALSIEEVHTAHYAGQRQTTFRPCQAVVLWVRLRNEADIPQTAMLFWRTYDPGSTTHANLSGHRQVRVPPDGKAWRFVGSPDLDAPAGEYHFDVWFTSGTDRQAVEGAITVAGQPAPTRFLEGMTAKIDPRDYEFRLSRIVPPGREYVTYPARPADVFTPEDKFVIQSVLWEGVRPETVIVTRRYRPDGRPFGTAIYGVREYELRPSCLRRQNLYWHIEDMTDNTGQWRLEISADGGETWAQPLLFTITDE